jgi:alpha-L-fucosidase 2
MIMQHLPLTLIALTCSALVGVAATAPVPSVNDACAVSTRPLTNWASGFLTGNGNMGVIMAGDPYNETLVINGKLYLPTGAKEVLPNLAAFKDEFKKAGLAAGKDGPATVHKLVAEKSGQNLVHTDAFHPACLLQLGMKGSPGTVKNYRMTEDFTTGELQVRWSDDQGDWSRKLFVSRPDDVIVMTINGPKGKVDCNLAMEINHPLVSSETTVENDWLAAHNTYLKGKGGYDTLIRVMPAGGRIAKLNNSLAISGADSILLLMQVKKWKAPLPRELGEAWAFSPEHPDFRSAYSTNRIVEMKQVLSCLPSDYERLLTPHAQAHGALYHRVSLDLGGGDDRQLTSEDLLARAARDGVMPKALAERLYNACRYLIICSNGDTPPNLQGVWTGTWTPEWSGDYTLDSNLQLEIQSMMSCNMPELMGSYFDLIDSWLPDWRLNAKKLFGFRGVVSSLHASNHCLLFPRSGFPREQVSIGIAGWLLHFYYDYYQFTGDREFLARRFVPLAKEIALFYEDFLSGTEDANGKYRFYMGCSPEHGLTANTTYDIAVAKNVLTTLLAACQELGIELENRPKWQAMFGKMPLYLINDAGVLQEWAWPGVPEEPNHRHHSQFLPLYQFCEFDREKTPALWKAAGLAFAQKEENWLRNEKGANSNHITHGMMNQGQCAARLGRGDVVYDVLARMVTRQYVYPSFMISYWPGHKGFGFDPVGTIPDVINNSLIFAWKGIVDILPALPKEWPIGSISGVLLRGQIQVQQLAWDIPAGKINLTLRSDITQAITLRFPPTLTIPANCRRLMLKKGESTQVVIAVTETETKVPTTAIDEAKNTVSATEQ